LHYIYVWRVSSEIVIAEESYKRNAIQIILFPRTNGTLKKKKINETYLRPASVRKKKKKITRKIIAGKKNKKRGIIIKILLCKFIREGKKEHFHCPK
jgi:hypothetical protein